MTDSEKLLAVATKYNALMALNRERTKLQAELLRSCVYRLEDVALSRKQMEAIKALKDLADMLEKQL